MIMVRFLRIAVVLWAWACWGWVIYSREWLWLIASIVPYLLYTSFGHLGDRQADR